MSPPIPSGRVRFPVSAVVTVVVAITAVLSLAILVVRLDNLIGRGVDAFRHRAGQSDR